MTVSTLSVAPEATASGAAPTAEPTLARSPVPRTRVERLTHPLAKHVLRSLAEQHGVCVNPTLMRRIDRDTGEASLFEVPCGSRREAKCKPCAQRVKRLRQQQLREGWHRTDEPTDPEPVTTETVLDLVAERCQRQLDTYLASQRDDPHAASAALARIAVLDDELVAAHVRGHLANPDPDAATDSADTSDDPPPQDADAAAADKCEASDDAEQKQNAKKTRSTRRRPDVPDLPRQKVTARTVGRTYTGTDGTVHRPSTLLTVTLPSYGPVHTQARMRRDGRHLCGCGALHGVTDPLLGTPLDPGTYDYRAAALGAVFFAATLDRYWQNLRRATGYDVQYAGAVEMQKRLAPHAHFAVRGTIARKLLKHVAAATYHQVWWPKFNRAVYTVAKPPLWDSERKAYVDPKTGESLKTWTDALAELDAADAEPAHVAWLGSIDARGVEPGTKTAERGIRYLTKYITKDIADDARPDSDPQRVHFDRLHAELATVPCSPTCASWLLYGVQPKKARPGLEPGSCSGKVHQAATLGYTGRRVLVSRKWSNKTLADHRADNRDHIRRVLAAAGVQLRDQTDPNDRTRYDYEIVSPGHPDVPDLQLRIMHAIAIRQRWRAQLAQAQQDTDVSATRAKDGGDGHLDT